MKTADELFDGSNAHLLDDSAVDPLVMRSGVPNKPDHQAKIDKIRGLVKDQEEWIGMYIIAFERAEDCERKLKIATDALHKIANWYDGESDFSGDAPTGYAAETLKSINA